MAKKHRKIKRHYGKTEDEWENWGENFGKYMRQRGKEFGEEVEDLAEKFEKRTEGRDKEWKKESAKWWFGAFGPVGPLIRSIIGILFLAIGILLLNFINMSLNSVFIYVISNFLLSNLYLFFALLLFFGYSDYFSKKFSNVFWVVSPITTAIAIIFILWIAANVLNLINLYISNTLIASVSIFIINNLQGIFMIFLVLGYAIIFIKKLIMYYIRDLK